MTLKGGLHSPHRACTGSTVPIAIAAATTVLLWASGFPGIRVGLTAYGPGELALLRFLTASTAFTLYALIARPRFPSVSEWPRMVALGASGVAGYNLGLNMGEQTVTAGSASFLVGTVPLFTALLASLFLRETLHRRLLVGLVVGLAGVAMISFGEGEGFGTDIGALFVLGAALLQATFFVLQKGPLVHHRPIAVMASATWAGTILLTPFFPGLMEQLPDASGSATVAAVYLGLFPGAIAFAAWAFVLSRLPASVAAPFLYVVPVVATLIAWSWLGETPEPAMITGGVVIIAGVMLSRRRTTNRAHPARSPDGPGRRPRMAKDAEPVPEFLERVSVRDLKRIDVGLEGDWSRSVGTIWTPAEGFLGFDAVVDRHPSHRPALEFLFPEGWIGVRCSRQQNGQHVLDRERAAVLVDLAARRRFHEQR